MRGMVLVLVVTAAACGNNYCPGELTCPGANSSCCPLGLPYLCGHTCSATRNAASCSDPTVCEDRNPDGGTTAGGMYKRMFITSTTFRGDFGGIAFADSKCNISAVAANLGGTWKAWLSDPSTNAIDRIADVGPWYLVDGKTKVFNNKTNLMTNPIAPISQDENGAPVKDYSIVEGCCSVNYGAYWTGTDAGGMKSAATCSNWTANNCTISGGGSSICDASGRGETGSTAAKDAGWTGWSGSPCEFSHGFLCIEQ